MAGTDKMGSGALQAEHFRLMGKEPTLGILFSLAMFFRGLMIIAGLRKF